ncbi:MYO3B-like protein [Mya arenaria]|uniref:MYO3B-like protein n=1 Tax=Mya arenaria TaxID=6604 RepID=A0ABY7E5C9_MYAAR|nr:MYO3B-like protein [Mya arenaria]
MEMAEILDSDLSRLDNLTDETILKALKGRYDRDLIYTKVRDILIAINPRKPLPIYENEVHETYHWDRFTGDCEPHVFHIAASAYKRMRDTETDQVIIVSGESGAGKTESTKYMVKHIVHMCQSGNMDLHEKIIEVNPLLEAFGNAKTILNENSSRFAKYLDITFKEDGQLAGAVVRDYMLEKSRVVFQSPDEGIFHIFYALFYGCPPEKMEDLFLASDMDQFRIMRSDAYAVYKKDEYKEMYNKIMHILDLIKADREVMHMMLAAVINITEIEFEEDDKGAATIKDAAPFVHASLLLQLDEELLGEALISSRRKLKEGIVASYKTVKQAEDGRDALAKILYERMFGWLVRVVNQSLHPDRLGTNICGNIGILDIAGFEKLRKNSFEQLCINIVNEKLQNFMNRRIFTMEMEIYQDENIHLDGISFKNNDDIIEMFEQPKTGLLAVLDEVSNFKQGSDQAFALQIKKAFKEHPNFVNQGVETMFGISHFAAMVPYDAEGFMEKNRDRLNPELMDVMKASTDEFISDLFSVKRGPTGTISSTHMNYRQSTRHRPGHQVTSTQLAKVKLKQTPKGQELAAQLGKSLKTKFGTVHKPSKTNRPTPPDQTLVAFFRKSLLDLLAKLGSAEPFFVRCIKANNTHRENEFDSQVVNDQLKYNGLAEVAKIRKMGFAVRKPFQEFVTRYRCLSSFLIPSGELRGQAEQILLQSPAKYHKCFRLGKTKVFFTHELDTHFEVLLHLRRKIASKQVTKVMKRVAQIKKAERLERERQEIERKRLEQERLEHEQQEKEKKERESQNSVYENPDVTQEEHSDQENTASSDEDNTGNDPLITLGGTAKPILGGTFDRTKESTYTGGSFKDYRGTRPSHDHKKQMKKQIPFWDVAQIIARERRIRDVDEDRGLQVIKVVAYIVFIAAMLWCAVSQKLSLMTLVSHQYNRGEFGRSYSKTYSFGDCHFDPVLPDVPVNLSEFNFKVNVEGEEEEDKETPSKSRENMGNTNVVGDIEEGFLTNNEDNDDEETDVNSDSYRNPKFRDVPMIYACATMWHETKVEMIQLMKSIFRMDRDQNLRRMGEILAMKEDKDFYEMEAHIFFDDCMELDDDGEMIPNQFVKSLLSILDEAVSAVYSKFMKCKKPFLVPTPYGGQLVISMPGDNFLFIHLKDKAKIRHKKRWSQVMYMYYLLGFRIVRHCQEYVTSALESGKINELISWEDGANAAGNIGKSHIFHVRIAGCVRYCCSKGIE